MKRTTPQNRRILQVPLESGALQNSDLSPDPIFQPKNGSSETRKNPTTSSLDSSMTVTILVLLTALFFMGLFSIYIRRFAEEDSSDNRRRRHPSRPSSARPGGLRN
ncbi:hypothetical protein ACH5RR_009808 [Cinchona calisaya]|uniref:Uncharacterized protein n=1 Tax=Cinchona calisaya TaxID=153742 RepID=A0ABD3AHA8_9GENT